MWIDGNKSKNKTNNKHLTTLQIPHKYQMKIIDSKSRFKVLACGRRFGKSITLLTEAYVELLKYGHRVAYLAPTFTMLLDFWNELKVTLSHAIKQKSEQEKMLILKNGAYFKGFSANTAEVIRGGKYHLFLIDEAAVVSDLGNIWNNIVRPTLTDYEGKATFGSTPKGNDFFKTLFDRGRSLESRYVDYSSFRYPTWYNPFLKRKEVLASVQDVSEKAARQEIMAEFLTDAGSIFVGVKKASTGRIFEPYRGDFVMGVDLAKQNDYTVVSIYDVDKQQIVSFDRFNLIGWQSQIDRIVSYNEKWNSPYMMVERNNVGDVIYDLLLDRGLNVDSIYTTNDNKREMIEGMAADIQYNNIILPSDPNSISEFQTFESKVLPSGKMQYRAGKGFHDDIVLSFSIARHAAKARLNTFGDAIPVL